MYVYVDMCACAHGLKKSVSGAVLPEPSMLFSEREPLECYLERVELARLAGQ